MRKHRFNNIRTDFVHFLLQVQFKQWKNNVPRLRVSAVGIYMTREMNVLADRLPLKAAMHWSRIALNYCNLKRDWLVHLTLKRPSVQKVF
jgi:hypothetical protein